MTNGLPRVEMWCSECNAWVQARMFYFGDKDTFLKSVTFGNTEPCPKNHLVTHDKKYLRYIDTDGKEWSI